MKLPTYKRINKQDYDKDTQPVVEKLSYGINDGFNTLFNLGNNNISLNDNIYCQIKDINVNVDALGIPKTAISFTSTLTSKPIGSQVIALTNTTNSSIYANATPFVTFTQTDNRIFINHIAGLPPDNNFKLTLVIYG